MPRPYVKAGDPKRADCYRQHDQGVPAESIALALDVSVQSVWRWLRERPPAEPPVVKAQRLLGELGRAVHDLARTRRSRSQRDRIKVDA